MNLFARHNWASPIRQSFRYQTSSILSRSGMESRLVTRDVPRTEMTFTVLSYEGFGLEYFRALSDSDVGYVSWADPIRSAIATVDNDRPDKIKFPGGIPRWVQSDRSVAVRASRTWQFFPVARIEQDGVILSGPLSTSGEVILSPVLKGYLQRETKRKKFTSKVAFVEVDLVSDDENFLDIIEEDYARTFRGLPYCVETLNWASAPEDETSIEFSEISSTYSKIFRNPVAKGNTRSISFLINHKSPEGFFKLLSLFSRVRGSWGRLFFVDPTEQWKISSFSPGESSLELDVPYGRIPKGVQGLFDRETGETLGVNFIEEQNGFARVHMDTNATSLFEGGIVQPVFLGRFLSDELEVEWATSRLGESKIGFKVLPEGFDQLMALDSNITIGGDYVIFSSTPDPAASIEFDGSLVGVPDDTLGIGGD